MCNGTQHSVGTECCVPLHWLLNTGPLADACLERMSELKRDCRVFTLDRQDSQVYRRFDRQVIRLAAPE